MTAIAVEKELRRISSGGKISKEKSNVTIVGAEQDIALAPALWFRSLEGKNLCIDARKVPMKATVILRNQSTIDWVRGYRDAVVAVCTSYNKLVFWKCRGTLLPSIERTKS